MSRYNNKRKNYRRRNKRKRRLLKILLLLVVVLIVLLARTSSKKLRDKRVSEKLERVEGPDFATQLILDEDCNSRNGKRLETVRNVVVHYVANPGTTAKQNRDYFSNDDTDVNAHFVIGLEGEIIQCLPLYEQSVSSNWRNPDIISIEVCHPDESGKFNDETMDALIRLTAWLCEEFELRAKDVIRHYDITEKMCPLYYVEHEDAWNDFIEQVDKRL